MDDWIIIKTDEDLPKHDYSMTHKIYLCITESGKTLTCKYKAYRTNEGKLVHSWENASHWRDNLGNVVAYKEIHIPDFILNLCTGSGIGKKCVEYFDGLK